MATALYQKKESSENTSDISQKKFVILVSDWNTEITESLYSEAVKTLRKKGALIENIIKKSTPGSYELPLAAQWAAQKKDTDAVICLGCVIQGETRHFEFICQAVAQGLVHVSLQHHKPVIFGVLTTDTHQQALDRAGGKYGNKGEEAALAAIDMISLLST